jgi:hypothetical protein
MLVFGRADHGQQPGVVSPWIDADFAPIEDYLQQVQAQQHRRYLKTHTPLDGIPYHPQCTYLVVFRDPRDVFFSGINHRDNMTDQELANSAFPSGDNAFQRWLDEVREPDTWDLQSVDSLVHFFNSYWPYRDLPNVHVYHYSDLKRDLRGAIASMAAACNIEVSDAQLDAYAEAATFDSMRNKADQFAPMSGGGDLEGGEGLLCQWLKSAVERQAEQRRAGGVRRAACRVDAGRRSALDAERQRLAPQLSQECSLVRRSRQVVPERS